MTHHLTTDELELAQHLIESLALEGLAASDIAPEAMLFGNHVNGLGLDSLDALKVVLMLNQKYDINLASDDAIAEAAFKSLRNLAQYVMINRCT